MSKKLRLKISKRLLRKKLRKAPKFSKKHCRFESSDEMARDLDYKNSKFLSGFLSESGKIVSSRVSGNSAFYQRFLTKQIKLARSMALLPYCSWSK